MAIYYSPALMNRLAAMVARTAGSEAMLAFYSGTMPDSAEDAATGEKVASMAASEADLRKLATGTEPELPQGAGYWRVFDNGGLVLLQGDGK